MSRSQSFTLYIFGISSRAVTILLTLEVLQSLERHHYTIDYLDLWGMSISVADLPDGKRTIETPRLLLRPTQLEDAGPIHEAFGDSEVMRYWYVQCRRG